ncbi:MAG: response regulator transcription factor [Verrucomicrobiota bacterium]|nr:response regulator transcription factor [Verrucomicrobiota bacterium]
MTVEGTIGILIADDHPVVREGLRVTLGSYPRLQIVAEAEDGEQAVRMVHQFRPNVVLMDINMPQMSGVQATQRICRECPETKVLVLTIHNERHYLVHLMKAGAKSFVLKDCSPAELLKAIETIHAGGTFLSPSVSPLLLDQEEQTSRNELTRREIDVLRLLSDGLSNKQIADQLNLSVRTVETHREKIISKTGIGHIAGLTRFAITKGYVSLNERDFKRKKG